jgi:transcriptional regulator with XRE-family HTH domain
MLISCQMATDFSEWLQNELARRDMTPADLARNAMKDQGIISRIIRRERKPEPETLEAIARAFKLPPEHVFRMAGLLPLKENTDAWVEEMNHKMGLLDPSKRPMAEKLLNALLEEDKPVVPVGKKARIKG